MISKEWIKFFEDLTQKTSIVCKQYYRQPINIELKNDMSPVTMVDKQVEEIIISSIEKEFKGHSIHAEETGVIKKDSDYEWVIDPIDGTKTFIHGVPMFATIIALLHKGNPVLGVYHNPILGDLIIGDNETCLYNGRQTKVRQCKNLSDATILTTDHFTVGKFRNQTGFDNLVKQCKMYRTWADAYGYFLIATGYADIMIDPIMSRWDSMAIIPIIKGSKGAVTDYLGNNPVESNSLIAAPENLINEIVKILNPNK